MPVPTARLRLPSRASVSPLQAIALRLGVALGLVLLAWLLVLVERDSYRDSADGTVSVVDALYYTTVTLSTTGYGDITPVTTTARLVNALVITPMPGWRSAPPRSSSPSTATTPRSSRRWR